MKISNPSFSVSVSKSDYFFVFLSVIFIGSGTLITMGSLDNFGVGSGHANYEPLIGKAIMLLYSFIILAGHNQKPYNMVERNIIIVVIIWGFLQAFKYRLFPTAVVTRFMNIYFTMVLFTCYGKSLLTILEDVFYKLAVIGFILWVISLIIPSVMQGLCNFSPIKGGGMVEGGSILVFAPNYLDWDPYRNFGFAWEPGRFGAIMTFGLFINLVLYNFTLKNNRHFKWFVAAIVSSLSTTAFSVLLFVLYVYYINQPSKYRIMAFPIFIVGFVLMMSLDFMFAKMQDLSIFNEDHMIEWENGLDYYAEKDGFYTPQRFESLMLEGLNILHDPIIGNAGSPYEYLQSVFGPKFSLSNGVLRIFAQMGIPLGMLYYYLCFQGSKWLSELFKYKGKYAFILLFMLINFSYSFIFEPVFLSLLFYPYLNKRTLRYAS